MKIPLNFRLPQNIVLVLENLSKDLNISKTQVIEYALVDYAKRRNINEHPLAKFAGILKDEEVVNIDTMLFDIRKNKTYKNIKLDL